MDERQKTYDARGYLTIFLALSITVILSLCAVLVEGARTNGARFITECAVDVSIDSLLAEYHRELLNQYDLLFVDMSYGTNQPSSYRTVSHFEHYLERNFSCNDIENWNLHKDLFGMSIQNIRIGDLAIATDCNGFEFRRQAENYMRDNLGLSLLSQVDQWEKIIKENSLENSDVEARRNQVDSQIRAYNGQEIRISEEERVIVEVDNPADQINAQRNKGILVLVFDNPEILSNIGFDKSKAASQRRLSEGKEVPAEKEADENIADLLLFDEYIMNKCSFFGAENTLTEKAFMKYQVEYILMGKDNDLDNLKAIANRLLAMREAANVAYLLGDSAKRAEISALAATVSILTLLPQLQELLELSILFAWAFAESVSDVRALFQGGRVPLLKSTDSWNTSLTGILNSSGNEYNASGSNGLTYKDYLKVFLKMEEVGEKTMRTIDMAELDIRKTPGNHFFRMDGCTDFMKIDTNVVSKRGDVFCLQRTCSYD